MTRTLRTSLPDLTLDTVVIGKLGRIRFPQQCHDHIQGLLNPATMCTLTQDDQAAGIRFWPRQQDPRIRCIACYIDTQTVDKVSQRAKIDRGKICAMAPDPQRRWLIKQLTGAIGPPGQQMNLILGPAGWPQADSPVASPSTDAVQPVASGRQLRNNEIFWDQTWVAA